MSSISPAMTYLVIGASRGIGLALVEELSRNPSNLVIASTRKPVDFGIPNVQNVVLDQTDGKSVESAAEKMKAVDVLILNAAIGGLEYLLTTSTERLQEYLETNILGVHRVINAFLPALEAGSDKKIIVISSTSGSLAVQKDSTLGFQGPYAVTKTANNMQVVQYHNELSKDGFTVVAIHPGWVATEMGNSVKVANMTPIAPEESARGLIKRIVGLKREDSGTFLVYDGSTLPW